MANWSWPSTAAYDERVLLPLFNLTPNWKNGVLERLEWLTDVMSSEIAQEQRRSVRRFPRRSFEVSFMRLDSERARLDNFFTGIGRNKFLVPLWHDQFKLPEAPGIGEGGIVTFPAGTLQYREFAMGDLVLISADTARYTLLKVISKSGDTITLGTTVDAGTWAPGSRITPLRVARVLDPMSLSNPSERVGQSQIRFSLSDADDRFPESWGVADGADPIWAFKPDRATEVNNTYDRSAFMLDMGAGVIEVTDPGNLAMVTTSMALTLYGYAAIAKFRAFLYKARGKACGFHVPSYTRDMMPIENITGATFDVAVNGFNAFMPEPQGARQVISVLLKNGSTPIYRTITAIAPVNSATPPFHQIAERFTVDPAFPTISLANIERMSFLVPSRFDQDSFEILHVTDNGKGAKAAVVMKSCVLGPVTPPGDEGGGEGTVIFLDNFVSGTGANENIALHVPDIDPSLGGYNSAFSECTPAGKLVGSGAVQVLTWNIPEIGVWKWGFKRTSPGSNSSSLILRSETTVIWGGSTLTVALSWNPLGMDDNALYLTVAGSAAESIVSAPGTAHMITVRYNAVSGTATAQLDAGAEHPFTIPVSTLDFKFSIGHTVGGFETDYIRLEVL